MSEWIKDIIIVLVTIAIVAFGVMNTSHDYNVKKGLLIGSAIVIGGPIVYLFLYLLLGLN